MVQPTGRRAQGDARRAAGQWGTEQSSSAAGHPRPLPMPAPTRGWPDLRPPSQASTRSGGTTPQVIFDVDEEPHDDAAMRDASSAVDGMAAPVDMAAGDGTLSERLQTLDAQTTHVQSQMDKLVEERAALAKQMDQANKSPWARAAILSKKIKHKEQVLSNFTVKLESIDCQIRTLQDNRQELVEDIGSRTLQLATLKDDLARILPPSEHDDKAKDEMAAVDSLLSTVPSVYMEEAQAIRASLHLLHCRIAYERSGDIPDASLRAGLAQFQGPQEAALPQQTPQPGQTQQPQRSPPSVQSQHRAGTPPAAPTGRLAALRHPAASDAPCMRADSDSEESNDSDRSRSSRRERRVHKRRGWQRDAARGSESIAAAFAKTGASRTAAGVSAGADAAMGDPDAVPTQQYRSNNGTSGGTAAAEAEGEDL